MSLFLSGAQQLSLQQDETHLDMKAQTFHEFSKLCSFPNVQHECVASPLEEVSFSFLTTGKLIVTVLRALPPAQKGVLCINKCIYLFFCTPLSGVMGEYEPKIEVQFPEIVHVAKGSTVKLECFALGK